MSHKPYPEYKESSIDWLGSIPVHWTLSQFKRLLDIQNGADQKKVEAEEGYPIYGSGGIFGYATDYLYDGTSILLGRKGTIDKPLFVEGRFWTVDTMYWSKVLPEAHPKFAYYLATLIPFDYYSTSTALPSMTKGDLGSHLVAYPGVEEQQAISAFLDRETAKIDGLIQKQEKLIELLGEKRKTLISQVVTKGLNPSVGMKDSGVPWLGSIPPHWSVKRLKHLGKAIIGLTYEPINVVGENEGTLVLRSSNIQNGKPCFSDNVYVNKDIPEQLVTQIGDILICSRNGSRKLIGKNITIDENLAGSTFGAFMTVLRSDSYKFLSWVLNSRLFEFQAASFLTTTVNQLTIGDLNNFEIPFPPIGEQEAISRFLDGATEKIDALVSKANQSMELLKEHRASLISAAVTGKIDVREMVQ